MSKIDVRLLYQKDTGLSLSTINKIMDDVKVEIDAHCDECGKTLVEYRSLDSDLIEYIQWLEEQLETALSVGEQLLISHNTLFRK